MSYLIADAPITYCLVRGEFLRDMQRGQGTYEEGCIFGVTAIDGRLPAFQVLLKNGAQWARLPLHALVTKQCEPLPLAKLCPWDCMSYHLAVHAYAFLNDLYADSPGGRGRYLFTIDYAEGSYAEIPSQAKCHHLLALDSGHLAAYPNNRLKWQETSWTKPFTERPDYLAQTTAWTTNSELSK